ncbi:uncharacterized protein LOC129595389 [Paramacrobiotus metropolitanus]|uniref:uncharacterized protein LOC129595389 n=1 Tax=Paramacrobiotus metropolitanus TaxID=2943436 RepID=UPI002446490E|nr:uncharacterized protein LOC129595389 [Paramacrobiotus metropolitanus]
MNTSSANSSFIFPVIKLRDDQFTIFFNVSLTLCICISSLILFVIILIAWNQRLRTGSGVLILHQLIVEFQLVAIHWPIFLWMLATSQHSGTSQTVTFCRHYHFSYMITVTASLWGLAFLALNRFVAIYLPFHYNKFISHMSLTIMIVLMWSIGFFTHLPFYLGAEGGFVPAPPSGICSIYNQQSAMIYALTNIPRTYLPLTFSALLYLLVFAKVGYAKWQKVMVITPNRINHIFFTASSNNANPGRKVNRELYQNRVTMARMLFIAAIIHCICFLTVPIGVTVAPGLYQRSPLYRNWLRTLFFVGYVSTPVLLLGMSKSHRDSAKRMLRHPLRPIVSAVAANSAVAQFQ